MERGAYGGVDVVGFDDYFCVVGVVGVGGTVVELDLGVGAERLEVY